MKEHSSDVKYQSNLTRDGRKLWLKSHWLILGVVSFALFFGLGYSNIFTVNPVHEPSGQSLKEKKQVLPKLPREYDPSDSLLDLKMERDRERSQETERIQEILQQIGLTDETRKQAEQELWRLTQASSKEQELETLLRAKGFAEAMVNISPKMVTVIVSTKLIQEQAAQLGELAAAVTDYNLNQIEIVESTTQKD